MSDLGPNSERVSLLFAMVTQAVARSGWALLSEDPHMGQGVVEGDQAIDELTAEIELAVWERLGGHRLIGSAYSRRWGCC